MPDLSAALPFFSWLPLLATLGGVSVLAASLALGIRHGIDWDHIAAITDITSTTAAAHTESHVLTKEPGIFLTEDAHPHEHAEVPAQFIMQAAATPAAADDPERSALLMSQATLTPAAATAGGYYRASASMAVGARLPDRAIESARRQGPALWLGTLYALGHGSVVFVLGALAILANEFLPGWIDPIMERVVGFTLLFLALYLFYSLYRYFRGDGEFKLRSRWMLVFATVRNAWEAGRERLFGVPRQHVHEAQQYGARTAYGIGMIHGIGAETGTQVLVITAAAGAGSKVMGLTSLLFFIAGLLISNSIVTVMTAFGFGSSRERQTFYVAAGLLAAVFSLVVGLVFITRSTDILPDLDPYFRWIGGPG